MRAKNFCSFHRPVLIFQPTVNCRASYKQSRAVSRAVLLTQRTAQLLCVDISIRVFGGAPFCLHRETLTFMCPAAYQNTAVIQIRANKIPTKFDTMFAMSLYGIRLFKGLNVRCIYMWFSVTGLKMCDFRYCSWFAEIDAAFKLNTENLGISFWLGLCINRNGPLLGG
jgi:hypothetical protein